MGIPEKLYAKLLDVSQEASVSILLSALDSMQGYNGQSVTEAIMDAIDADRTEHGWVVPTVAELEERFSFSVQSNTNQGGSAFTQAPCWPAGYERDNMQKITIEHQCSVDVNGADVASCLGHDMEKLIQFISDIDMALSDIEFPRAVLRWAQAAIESEAT